MSLFTVLATSKVAAGVLAAGTIAVGGTGAAASLVPLPALPGNHAGVRAAAAAGEAHVRARLGAELGVGTEHQHHVDLYNGARAGDHRHQQHR